MTPTLHPGNAISAILSEHTPRETRIQSPFAFAIDLVFGESDICVRDICAAFLSDSPKVIVCSPLSQRSGVSGWQYEIKVLKTHPLKVRDL